MGHWWNNIDRGKQTYSENMSMGRWWNNTAEGNRRTLRI